MTMQTNGSHEIVVELLAEYVLGGLSSEQRALVEQHLESCAACGDEIEAAAVIHRLAVADAPAPAIELRSTVLDAAFSVRPPRSNPGPASIATWESEVGRFLALFDDPDLIGRWDEMCLARFDLTIRSMACHLIAAESLWAQELGLDQTGVPETELGLEPRTRAVIDRHASLPISDTRDELDRLTELVGQHLRSLETADLDRDSGMIDGFSIDDYVTFRALETWTHADDVRVAIGRPEIAPAPVHLTTMTSVLPDWITMVLATEEPSADSFFRIELTGPGGQVLSVGSRSGAPETVLTCDTIEFCKLVAARRDPAAFDYRVEGDPRVAKQLVTAVAGFEVI